MMTETSAPSPCIGVCSMDEQTGYCKGCYRTLEEVSGWVYFSNEDKHRILAELDKRKACD